MLESVCNKTYFANACSNIALVKYWGKEHRQIPINPSISLTLTDAKTEMSVSVRDAKEFSVTVTLDNNIQTSFGKKLKPKIAALRDYFSWIDNCAIHIATKNSFPHSAGIASSASSMCALAYILLSIEFDINGTRFNQKKHSEIARLLSGSASRSVSGPVMLWGEVDSKLGTNEYAVNVNNYHPVYNDFYDAILVVDDQPKALSSSEGHALMNAHPYREARIALAKDHTRLMLNALREGDLKLFGYVLEQEALGLHGLMMTSDPSYTLLKPQTLKLIEELKKFRIENNCDCYFTLDAGPNIHLLYPKKNHMLVQSFIEQFELKSAIFDKVNLKAEYEY